MEIEEQSLLLPNEEVDFVIPEKLLQIVPGRSAENHDIKCTMPKVPPLLRQDKKNQQDYDPVVVSFGPYHHGKNELQLVEDFKMTALQMIVDRSRKDAKIFYSQVFHRVNDARNCYIKDSTKQYDDANFAQMMLLDACFLILCIDFKNFDLTHLGYLVMEKTYGDMILLENQIPFWLLKLVMDLAYEKQEGENMLKMFLHISCFGEHKVSGIAWRDEPHHLLGAYWQLLVDESLIDKSTTSESSARNESGRLNDLPNFGKCSHLLRKYTSSLPCFPGSRRNDNDESIKKYIRCFRSAMDLKAKGIHFRPSSAASLNSIKFKSGYFYATLELPAKFVDFDSKRLLLNLVAYEMCTKTRKDLVVTAYVEFMRSLIDGPNDVKELREKGILLTTMGSDEEVVNVYKEIKTNGLENVLIFYDVGKKIQYHYNNKAKTWLADLFYIYFRSPWTAIALFAATLLLVLTVLQTYYKVKRS